MTTLRDPVFRAFQGELVIDLFAGGGGASTGIERAIGRPCDIAINHSPEAIAMHEINHPETRHYCEDIWSVDPREAASGRPVGLAWFSPDCTHFSRAKGGKPKSKKIRGLAWTVIRWARSVRPRVILLENVEEFLQWGPLDDEGQPIKSQAGETFRAWLAELTSLGYAVEFKPLVAADYGAPTTRKRLFLVARCDGRAPVFPAATHGPGTSNDWLPAASIIDWTIPCPSIFGRKKPLAEKTMARIAAGIQRYVLETADPFIVPVTHGRGLGRVHGIDEPLRTVTGANRGELALVAPTMVQTGYGERRGQRPRALDLQQPLGTVVAGGQKHGLVAALLTKHYGGVVGNDLRRTLGTVTGRDSNALTAAFLMKYYGTSVGQSVRLPTPTVLAGGDRGGGHIADVRAFLVKYYGAASGQHQGLDEPIHTVTSKARFGLVTVAGVDYQIVDIGMRMLQPPELFAAQGFPEDYVIDFEYNGKPVTKTTQIKLCGNSVSPPNADALAEANAA